MWKNDAEMRLMRYIRKDELQDDKIIASIQAAAREYENGEIIEARDRMLEIIAAIDEWSDLQK